MDGPAPLAYYGPHPKGDPLTEKEVSKLPEGTPITVVWSGGNGPHDYVVTVRGDQRYAAVNTDPGDRMRFYNPLRFVGQRSYHTRVWLKEEDLVADTARWLAETDPTISEEARKRLLERLDNEQEDR